MSALMAALWGVIGGLCVDGLELHTRIRRTPNGKLSEAVKHPLTYLSAVAIRAGVGAAVAGAAAASGRVPDAFVALAFGVAAPLVIVMLTRAIRLEDVDNLAEPNRLASAAPPPTESEPALAGSEAGSSTSAAEAPSAGTGGDQDAG